MKLNFRDLKQQKFAVEAEPTDTIAQVKEKVAAEKGWDVGQQKLIYSGKILVDSNTVESYHIEEKGFIVCMVTKPKAAPAASTPAADPSTPSASTLTSTPAPPAAPQQNTATTAPSDQPATPSPATNTDAAAASTAPRSDAAFNDPSALLVGQQGTAVVAQMEAMGFQRSEIDRAMRAAFFNPDRAVDYLLNGIPASAQAEQAQSGRTPASNPQAGAGPTSGGDRAAANQPSSTGAQAAANPSTGGGATVPATGAESAPSNEPNLFELAAQAGSQGAGGRSATTGGAGAGAGGGAGAGAGGVGSPQSSLDFLRNNPQFQQLRQLVQQQPGMLEPVLQQVAEGNPQLAQMIQQNQDQFLQLLGEDNASQAGEMGIGGMGEVGPVPQGSIAVTVDEEDRDAIERLCRLGFSRDSVVTAYFACDKNEELAANFLFDQPDEEDG